MSLSDLVQLYAPFAGLMILCFWVGGLSQRVKTLEKQCDHGDLNDKVIRLETQMENANVSLQSMDRHLSGVNRQLANIATGKLGGLYETPHPDKRK